MSRFVDIGKYHINMDHVVSITPPQNKDGSVWIELVNGQQIETDGQYMNYLIGTEHIVQIIPVSGVHAILGNKDGSEEKLNVHALAVTADGFVRPLDATCDYIDFFDGVNNYQGIYWDNDKREE